MNCYGMNHLIDDVMWEGMEIAGLQRYCVVWVYRPYCSDVVRDVEEHV